MNSLTQDTVLNFQVENYVHLIIEEKRSSDEIKRRIQSFSLDQKEQNVVLQRLQFAIQRIQKNLNFGEILLLFFIPFGFIRLLIGSNTYLFNLGEEKRLGFVNRVKQFYLISFIGIFMWFLIIPGIIYSLR